MTTAPTRPSAIPGYEDWPDFMRAATPWPGALAGWLGVPAGTASDIQVGRRWYLDGLDLTEYTWCVGFGPRGRGVLVRPREAGQARLPGVLALHCHGGRKYHGLEKIVDLGAGGAERGHAAGALSGYEGRGLANYLAAQGAAVFVPDAFSWGARRFELDRECPARSAAARDAARALAQTRSETWNDERDYDAAAAEHEHTVAKVAGMLGTSFAGMVAFDDLLALDVFAGLGVADAVGAVGFSGGGGRAWQLAALDPRVRAVSVACMMTTFASLFPAYTDAHSWLLQTPHLAGHTEWPEIALLPGADFDVQILQGRSDPLFPGAGMREAERLLRDGWPGNPAQSRNSATGRRLDVHWYETGHEMTRDMQAAAASFLLRR